MNTNLIPIRNTYISLLMVLQQQSNNSIGKYIKIKYGLINANTNTWKRQRNTLKFDIPIHLVYILILNGSFRTAAINTI